MYSKGQINRNQQQLLHQKYNFVQFGTRLPVALQIGEQITNTKKQQRMIVLKIILVVNLLVLLVFGILSIRIVMKDKKRD